MNVVARRPPSRSGSRIEQRGCLALLRAIWRYVCEREVTRSKVSSVLEKASRREYSAVTFRNTRECSVNRLSFPTLIKMASILTFAAGCQSTHVEKAGSANEPASPYAPINENTRSGVVKYLNNGADFVIKSRREDA